MAWILMWFLCYVSISTVQGFSSQEIAGFKLQMTSEHYLMVNKGESPTVNVLCTLRDAAGRVVPLAGCEFQENYRNNTMQFNEGPASPQYIRSSGLTGKYQGRGLEHGECGLTFGGYEGYGHYILGCRARPAVKYIWYYAAILLHVDYVPSMQYHLQPPGATVVLRGSDITLKGKAEHALDFCRFAWLPARKTEKLVFDNSSAKYSLGHYHGSGLENKECGVTLLNLEPEESGFVLGSVISVSVLSESADFVELIVATAPDDVGMIDTTPNEDGIFNATCWAKNGRPVANITWLLGDKVIRQDSINDAPAESKWIWNRDPQSITQHLLHRVTLEDSGKQLTCRVGHMALPSGLLNIGPPEYINIKLEPSEMKLGAEVTFTCESGTSNPPATHTWYQDQTLLNNSITSTKPGQHGGQITTSNLTLNLTVDMNEAVIKCQASNGKLYKISNTTRLVFTFPPDYVTIIQEPSELKLGAVVTFTCESGTSNPPATHTWYQDQTLLNNSITSTKPGQYGGQTTTSNLTLNLTVDMNEAVIKCQVFYDKLYKINSTTKLEFNFPPDYVKIEQSPSELKLGAEVTFTCESGTSNPPATHTWYQDQTLLNNFITSTKPGQYGGQTTTSNLTLNLTVDMNEAVIKCQVSYGANYILNTTRLDVNYPPIFDSPPLEDQVMAFGQPFTLVANATANPSDINYTWTKYGVENVTAAEGPVLNFTHLSVEDSGWYTCTAVNNVGSAAWMFKLTVMGPLHVSHLDLKTYYIIAGATCLLVTLGALVTLLRIYKRLCWSVGPRPFSQELVSVAEFENDDYSSR